MRQRRRIEVSKFLTYVLRHKPETVGVVLDDGGWVDVDELLAACAAHGRPITREELDEVVISCTKRRFTLSHHGHRIRASQGHSVKVELGYAPTEPPDVLYHGTAEHSLPSIMQRGILRILRHHVHLSADVAAAAAVGRRHGKLVILRVDARGMHQAGLHFYQTPNGVWLTEHVPVQYISTAT